MSWVRWRIVGLLFLVSFVAYLLRSNMSVAGDGMMADLELSKVQFGMILAAFAWGYGLFQFPGGIFGDRAGGRRALALLTAAWGVLTLLVALVPEWRVLALLVGLRFLMGAVQAPLFPVYGGLVYHWFPAGSWALPNALGNTGITLGAAAAGPVVAWLVQTQGWRRSFLVLAPLALVMAAVWWWYGRDRPSEHPSVNPEELKFITGERAAEEHAEDGGAWLRVLSDRNVLLIALSYFCSNYLYYFFFNWLYIYLKEEQHFSQLESGWFSAAPWVTGAVGATLGGIVCDVLARRKGIRWGSRWPVLVGMSLAAVFLYAAAVAADPYRVVLFLSLCLGFQQLSEGAFWAATIAVSGRHSSTGCGLLNTGGNLVGGVGALVVPLTVERFGWVPALATASVLALVSAALWFFIRADEVIS